MLSIPVYLKKSAKAKRPQDSEFYWVTRDGTFLCRNHPFFSSDAPAKNSPRGLAKHASACQVRYPKLGVAALEFIVAFFAKVYDLYQSEAIVLLYWDSEKERYKLRVPEQEATVWESYSGRRSPMDVSYKPPLDVPPHEWLIGDIHSHGDIGANASAKDREDERYQDGIHAIVGRIEEEPPQFHTGMSVDGTPFLLKFAHIFKGYNQRRKTVPQAWLDKVKIVVQKPMSWGGNYGWGYGQSQNYGSQSDDDYYKPKAKPYRND